MKLKSWVCGFAATGIVVVSACSTPAPECEDAAVSCGTGNVKACQQNEASGKCSSLYYQTPDGAQFPCTTCPTSKEQIPALCDSAAIQALIHCWPRGVPDAGSDAGSDDAGTELPDSGTVTPDSGTSTTCTPPCGQGYKCVSGACAADPAATWTITVTTGAVGAATTNIGSEPDPKVCLTLGAAEECTAELLDPRTATWNYAFKSGYPTTTTLMTGITFRFVDVDPVSDDTICNGTLALKAADFSTRTFKRACTADPASFFSGTLTPR